jgi:hypothetical protein
MRIDDYGSLLMTKRPGKVAVLPKNFQPSAEVELIRIGRDWDGGYLVEPRSLYNADVLVGLGINDDWSFERDFLERKPVPLFAFDGSISYKVLVRRAVRTLFRPNDPKTIVRSLRTALEYKRFFRGANQHLRNFVGMPSSEKSIDLRELFEIHLSQFSSVFLKIDIEGAEYRLLNDLGHLSNRISGLVIEFHDLDLHLDQVASFIEDFPLHLCHTHVNNYGGIDKSSTPLVIECTFTSETSDKRWQGRLPHSLDRANNCALDDVPLEFY